MATHTYRSTLRWEGSTATGYERYDRTHRLSAPPAAGVLELSSDAAFLGDAQLMNPEQLLLAAVSSCQLLSFLALAARSHIDILAYDDDAEAVMPTDAQPMRITRITLRPRIRLAAGSDLERVRRLVGRAHDLCFVANSLRADVHIDAAIGYAEER